MNVTLPWFVLPHVVDCAIINGGTIDLNVMCNDCKSWGVWSVWTTVLGCRKMCPKCGGHNTEKVGD
ncbi:hypothetical protein LCGC14_0329890 [marine sediment metagenome]|uniref:Uncharacterized protein n=1 Tax=marine sediment metagenome TaxID=412755 RepID=A0A0F9W416_9ZZZZ